MQHRLFFTALLLTMTPPVAAQVDRMAYRHFAWLEQQRRILLADLLPQAGHDVEVLARRRAVAAEALTQNREQLPLLTIARAIARVRGVQLDAGYLFRSGLQVYALPEVLVKGRELAVTVHAPYSGMTGSFDAPDEFAFALRVIDAKGRVVHRGEIAANKDITDLRQFRSVCKMDLSKLPEGRYHVAVDTILDGQKPRPTDLPLRVAFAIQHDYAERAGAFRLQKANAALVGQLQALEPVPRSILQGVAEIGSRAWFGTPGVDPGHALDELARAEQVRKRITAAKFPLAGISQVVTVALPAPGREAGSEGVVFVTLRLPWTGLPKPGSKAWGELANKPLCLVMPGVPQLDHEDRRPSFPHFTLPTFAYEKLALAKFDRERAWQLAIVESPGRMPNTASGLAAVLEHLPKVLPFDSKRLVLIGDGHGASAMTDLALEHPDRVAALVLVNGVGSIASPGLRTLKDVPILVVPGHGRVPADAINRFRQYAKIAERTDGLTILDELKWPWSLALPLAARRIEAFVREALR